MKAIKTKQVKYGVFVYAEDENGVRYNIIYNQNEDDNGSECGGIIVDSEDAIDMSKIEITDTRTVVPREEISE